MSVNLNNSTAIDPEDGQYMRMLQNLQGNILKRHGRDHSVNVFLRFKSTPREVGGYLAKLVDNQVITSAWEQHERGKAERENAAEMFGNLFLTASGYSKLNLDPAKLPHPTKYFLNGMKDQHSLSELQDPKPETWEPKYQNGQIDAMIVLAHQRADILRKKEGEIIKELAEFADVLFTECGTVKRNPANQEIEPFGFTDSHSNPIFFSTDVPSSATNWNPFASLSLVLVPDTLVQAEDCYGSYLVYRKLEQDVASFVVGVTKLAKELGTKSGLPVDPQFVGAMVVGRFAAQGTPLTLSDKDNNPAANDFIYAQDAGLRCPIFAHVRATNPRDATARRIVRRGIPYDQRQSPDGLPDEDVGLLFMCFQASIAEQFAYIQRQANRMNDALIGQSPDALNAASRDWPTNWGKGGTRLEFDTNWVKLKGGEFFFAPSLPFLASLKVKA